MKLKSFINRSNRRKSRQPSDRVDQFNSMRYRRNQTLDNHLSKSNNSSRQTTHKLVIHRRRVFTMFAVVFLLVILTWVVINGFSAQIVVQTNDDLNYSLIDYRQVVNQYYQQYPMHRLNFVLNEDRFENYVIEAHPEVKTISLSKTIMGRSYYRIEFRQAVASWEIEGIKYYVDSQGIPFLLNLYSEPTVQVMDNSGVEMQSISEADSTSSQSQLSAIVSKRFLSFIGQIVSQSHNAGIAVDRVEIPFDTIRELHVYLEQGVMVKMIISREADEQVSDMVRTLSYINQRGQTVEYIDVRVDGKAFYK